MTTDHVLGLGLASALALALASAAGLGSDQVSVDRERILAPTLVYDSCQYYGTMGQTKGLPLVNYLDNILDESETSRRLVHILDGAVRLSLR